MDINMVVSGFFGLVGVLLGWILNQLSQYFENKPKLAFVISISKEPVSPTELRTKTSSSEYVLEMVNIGKVPVILNQVSICYNEKTLIDCFLDDSQRMIMPNQSKSYQLMEQDRNTLQWNCDKYLFQYCYVTAYCYDGEEIKEKLDVYDFYGRAIMNKGLIGRKNFIVN